MSTLKTIEQILASSPAAALTGLEAWHANQGSPSLSVAITALLMKRFSNKFDVQQKVADYTLGSTDHDNVLLVANSAGLVKFTIPLFATSPFVAGEVVSFTTIGAGGTSIDHESGVTLISPETYALRKVGSIASAICLSTDTWLLAGDLDLLP
jgi:hypothetical protein